MRLKTVSNHLFLSPFLRIFYSFLSLLIIGFSSIITDSSISTWAEAQGCINHGVINRNNVKARVKHRGQADMNTHFDWPGTWRQRTFQLAEGTSPRQALCRSPDTSWVFAVIILLESVRQQCVLSVPGWFFFLSFWRPSQENLLLSSETVIFRPHFASGNGLFGGKQEHREIVKSERLFIIAPIARG